MTRDEWNAYAESVPLTRDQRGAIMREAERLRLADPADRAERLAIFAELLGVDELGSTADLTLGQAGRLVAMLRDVGDRSELPDVTTRADGEDQADEGAEIVDDNPAAERLTWPEAIIRIIAVIYAAWHKPISREGDGSNDRN
jgi:hypothetical protein